MATNVVLVVVLVGVVVVSTKAFIFHNQASSTFAYKLLTTISRTAMGWIFK